MRIFLQKFSVSCENIAFWLLFDVYRYFVLSELFGLKLSPLQRKVNTQAKCTACIIIIKLKSFVDNEIAFTVPRVVVVATAAAATRDSLAQATIQFCIQFVLFPCGIGRKQIASNNKRVLSLCILYMTVNLK